MGSQCNALRQRDCEAPSHPRACPSLQNDQKDQGISSSPQDVLIDAHSRYSTSVDVQLLLGDLEQALVGNGDRREGLVDLKLGDLVDG